VNFIEDAEIVQSENTPVTIENPVKRFAIPFPPYSNIISSSEKTLIRPFPYSKSKGLMFDVVLRHWSFEIFCLLALVYYVINYKIETRKNK
jgi:hypothetical protein